MLDSAFAKKRHASREPERRFGRPTALGLLGAVLAVLVGAHVAAASPASKTVSYRGYSIQVPAPWPVYDLSANPSKCVRFDEHAVYLGSPGANEQCPAHAVGRTEALLIEPLARAQTQPGTPNTLTLPRGRVSPSAIPATQSAESILAIPAAGVRVTASWGRNPGQVDQILRGAQRGPSARTAAPAQVPQRPTAPSPASSPTTRSVPYFNGTGFDTCDAPSTSAMSAWLSSPYRAIGIYIGGANRACGQANLTSTWVGTEVGAGWQLIPLYVGPQAPGACRCPATVDPNSSTAASQGTAAANDAVLKAQSLGIGPGNPIYYDMEGYAIGGTNTSSVLAFLSYWTATLHINGYVSGVYGSVSSTIADLVSQYGTTYPEPDDIWIARWNNQLTTADTAVPAGDWANHQRIHQYMGDHAESFSGVTLHIDSDCLDGAVVGFASGAGVCASVAHPRPCGKVRFGGRKSGAFNIRAFNVRNCAKARKVAKASRARRFGPRGRARHFASQSFSCQGISASSGRPRVVYNCARSQAQISFVRKG